MNTFTVTKDHIKLLRSAYVSWFDCEFGAPSINPKRPYGNSDVHYDIAEILGIPKPDDEYDGFRCEDIDRMDKIHKETQTALQIFLATGVMEAGDYKSSKYDKDWKKFDKEI